MNLTSVTLFSLLRDRRALVRKKKKKIDSGGVIDY